MKMGLSNAMRPYTSALKRSVKNLIIRFRTSKDGVVIKLNTRLDGVKLGSGDTIAEHVYLTNVSLAEYVNVAHHAEIASSSIGKRTSVGRYTKIRDAKIGSYCSISWDVTIGATAHRLDHSSTHAFWYRSQFGLADENLFLPASEVTVGNDVWIGCGAILMPGITIGDGAVVGAGSVVTKDVPPYTVIAGAPAKPLKSRFDSDVAMRLRKTEWWNWSDALLTESMPLFSEPLSFEILDKMEQASHCRE